jgi:hypothetical protein
MEEREERKVREREEEREKETPSHLGAREAS